RRKASEVVPYLNRTPGKDLKDDQKLSTSFNKLIFSASIWGVVVSKIHRTTSLAPIWLD
ncbi:uncharacterized protein METZ01_LOCUS512837, partial [marine metagenome]